MSPCPRLPFAALLLTLTAAAGCPTEDDDCCAPPPEEPCDEPVAVTVDGGVVTVRQAGVADVELNAGVLGEGTLTVELAPLAGVERALEARIVAGDEGGVFEALLLDGSVALGDGDAPTRLWKQGYQSWSWSGVLALEALPRDARGLPEVGGDGHGTDVAHETAGTSWWAALVADDGGRGVLAGALSATRTRFWVGASDAGELALVWGGRGARIELAPGETLTLDPVWFGASCDAAGLVDGWAAAVAARVPPRPLDTPPPVGWATWYQYYEDVAEADVIANLDEAAAMVLDGDEAPIELFQVDDGWEVAWGDWTANERFPSGSAGLATAIRDAGFTAGLWMAPFYVGVDTPAFGAHDDWWVRVPEGPDAGTVMVWANSGGAEYALIDVTHPDALAWMARQVADRVDEGWTYLKLDFLCGGAVEGTRQQPVTGIEAYQIGMAALREAAGDAWVLACGAPLLPSVGWVESYRSGADIAFSVLPDPDPAFIRWQARSTAARGFVNGVWWWNDPDQLLVRGPLDDDHARGAIAAQAASGGTWLLGDDLAALDPTRLAWALDPEAVASRGRHTRPVDPLAYLSGLDPSPVAEVLQGDDRVPVRWELGDDHTVLLNLGDEAIEVACPGGEEALSGEDCGEGEMRMLAAGSGEIWVR